MNPEPLPSKPDIWMPFNWPRFQASTIGMRRETKWSYFNALCAYWWTDVKGLPDDEAALALICECEATDWARTRPMIFGARFKLLEGVWHHEWAREQYWLARANLERASQRGRKGALARWQSSSNAQAQPELGSGAAQPIASTPTSTSTNKSTDTPNATSTEKDTGAKGSRPASECDSDWLNLLAKDTAYAGIDVLSEYGKMVRWCEVRKRMPTRKRMINWLNGADKPMTAPAGGTQAGRSASANLTIASKELDRVNAAIERLKNTASRDPFGAWTNQKDKLQLRTLKDRRTQLMTTLNVQV